MSNCDVCDEEIIERPMYRGVVGGDWIATCEICGWHSEDETDSRINLNPSKDEIISQKKLVNSIRADFHDLIYGRNRSKAGYDLDVDGIFQKLRELSQSMVFLEIEGDE